MYKKFMQHAKKLTNAKTDAVNSRPVLKGVKHYYDGTLAVTDSHRLYVLKDAHDLKESLICPTTNREIEGNYPDVYRLIPSGSESFTTVKVRDLYKGIDIISLGAKAFYGPNRCMVWDKKMISFESDDKLLSASYELPFSIPADYKLASNVDYWKDALLLFRALGYDEIVISLYGPLKPFTLQSVDEKLTVLILPLRRY